MKKLFLTTLVLLFLSTGVFAQQTLFRQAGTLESGDARGSDGGFVEQYAVPVPQGTRIAVLAVSVDFDPQLVIEHDGGQTVAEVPSFGSAYASIYTAKSEGLIVRVSAEPGERGEYAMRVYQLPVEPAPPIGGSIRGRLESSDERTADGRYVDWYPLRLRRSQRVTVVASAGFDSYLYVEYPNGRRYENDDFIDTDAGAYVIAASDMTVLIGVSSLGSEVSGEYELSVESAATPPEISVGEIVNGALTSSDEQQGMTADRYLLSGRDGQIVNIRLESDDFDSYLMVQDGSGMVMENDDAPDGGRDSELQYAFTEDSMVEMTVRAFDNDGRGNYRLSVTRYDSKYPFREVEAGYPLSNGERVFTMLSAGGMRRQNKLSQHYTFEAMADQPISILVESSSFDGILEVVAPSGDSITDDDSGGNGDPLVEFVAEESGVFNVYVSSFSGEASGVYTIGLDIGAATKVRARIGGELAGGDSTDISGRYYDLHEIRLSSGDVVNIAARSSDFDSYLYLRRPDGTNAEENDDGGNGSDAEITYRAPVAGVYSVIVTSYSKDQSGRYQLIVTDAARE